MHVLGPLLLVLTTAAARPANEPTVETTVASAGEHGLRLRLGVLGGLAMQKTDLELGVGYDFGKLSERLRLTGDLTLGLRPLEITFEPMIGARLPLRPRSIPKLEGYVAGLIGANVTVMRGSVGVAVPLRLAGGLIYQLSYGFSLGLELSVEAGPLVAPFADAYGALHFGIVIAWPS